MRPILLVLLSLALACGGGGGSDSGSTPNSPSDPWSGVTSAIQAAQSQFPSGLCVEVLTPLGVVYSRSFGSFTNTTYSPVASASKIVSATVILRLVEQGALSLDTKTKVLLVDRSGNPWSGNMGEIRLRDLLSFTSGISGDVTSSDSNTITLEEAVLRIFEDQASTASPPGSYFYYGSTHLRIAARMAELATGKSWRQIFDEQMRLPLGWDALSTYGGGTNPNPAGGLACTGLEYTRFLMLQLRKGLDGNTRLLNSAIIDQQRADAFGTGTTIVYSPYMALGNRAYHYGFGNWLETANGQAPSPTNPVNRWSSTGKFGWAPWIAADDSYAGLIMTRQADAPGSSEPSDTLKNQLDPLIRTALSRNPPVIRTIP